MPIDAFPAVIQNAIIQRGYLDRLFQDALLPNLRYSAAAMRDPVPVGIGETITRSRPGLKPPVLAAQNPVNNTGLDNGLTPTYYPFEQYLLGIDVYSDTIDLNIEQNETLIQSLFEQNIQTNGVQAATSLDYQAALYMHKSAQSGNTFARLAAASGATSISVDNGFGFESAFSSVLLSSPGIPAAVSTNNKLPITIVYMNQTTGLPAARQTVNVQGVVFDGTNTSTAGPFYGASAALTLDAALTQALNIGDQILATDGSFVIRPNGKLTRYALTSADTISLQHFVVAKAKLRARQVPPGPNGLYQAIVDPLVMAQLWNDPQFVRATQGTFDRSPVFRDGVIAKALGIEFADSSTIPGYAVNTIPYANAQGSLANQGLAARRAVIMGAGAIVKGPFQGSLDAARRADGGGGLGISDYRIVNDIIMITRPALDRQGQVVSQTWKWTGGHVVPTDVTSNPTTIATSDYSRYKRMVEIEVAA